MVENKQAPVGVKIIAVLNYISAAVLLIYPILFLVGGAVLFGEMGAAVGGVLGSFFLILLLPFAVLSFFIGRGLWKGQKWARIITIIAGIGIFLSGLFSITTIAGIIYLVIGGFIAGYLLFSKEVKTFFA